MDREPINSYITDNNNQKIYIKDIKSVSAIRYSTSYPSGKRSNYKLDVVADIEGVEKEITLEYKLNSDAEVIKNKINRQLRLLKQIEQEMSDLTIDDVKKQLRTCSAKTSSSKESIEYASRILGLDVYHVETIVSEFTEEELYFCGLG